MNTDYSNCFFHLYFLSEILKIILLRMNVWRNLGKRRKMQKPITHISSNNDSVSLWVSWVMFCSFHLLPQMDRMLWAVWACIVNSWHVVQMERLKVASSHVAFAHQLQIFRISWYGPRRHISLFNSVTCSLCSRHYFLPLLV